MQLESVVSKGQEPAGSINDKRRSTWPFPGLLPGRLTIYRFLSDLVQQYRPSLSTQGFWKLFPTRRQITGIHKSSAPTVSLLPLLDELPMTGDVPVTLGIDTGGRPLVFNLLGSEIESALIAGDDGAGNSSLMRTMAASIALSSKQSVVQIAALELSGPNRNGTGQNGSLRAIGYLPHCMFPLIRSIRGGISAIEFIASEIAYRIEKRISSPLMVLFIKDADRFLEAAGEEMMSNLDFLFNRGAGHGLRLFMSIYDPDSRYSRQIFNYDFSLRIIGRPAEMDLTRMAAAATGMGIEEFRRRGEFAALTGEGCHHFQAAYVGQEDLLRMASYPKNQGQKVLLAKPRLEAEERRYPAGGATGGGHHLGFGQKKVLDVRDNVSQTNPHKSGPEIKAGSDGWLTEDWLDRFLLDND